MNRLFVDTSGWYAFLVETESVHAQVHSLFLEGKQNLVTSNGILSELFTLLVARNQESVALSFGEKLKEGKFGAFCRVSETDEEKGWKILKERRGRGLSYVDATTVALMNRLNIKTLVTLDNGFREFGLEILP